MSSTSHSQAMESVLSTVAGMHRQEESAYMVTNAYCGCRQHLDDENDCQHRELPMPSQRISDSLLDAASSFAYAAFRKQMVVWCYSIIDHCKFNREIVPITISYLDRFIATPAGSSARINREIYQLAAMACL